MQTWLAGLQTALFFLAFLTFVFTRRAERKKALEERDDQRDAANRMHEENKQRLNTLATFQSQQETLNRLRDQQVGNLEKQTVMLSEMAKGQEKRLELMENIFIKKFSER
ncbi:MAG: hypothetical protein JWQ87_5486 [Candidatus Sulfotelmatobacter sp.]|nr:hypothetical protein [Candidatus Sulfotelmatobacter sp.]